MVIYNYFTNPDVYQGLIEEEIESEDGGFIDDEEYCNDCDNHIDDCICNDCLDCGNHADDCTCVEDDDYCYDCENHIQECAC